jgi:cysteinyl-tRNA synthetase
MNLTDVDDKTIKGAKAKGISLKEYTDIYKKAFFEDLKTLRIDPAEHYPEATAYIPQMISMIESLMAKGAAYLHSDGSVYFSIAKAKEYGKLSHLNLESLQRGASGVALVDEYDREGVSDFVLWKAFSPERDANVFWESPWGKGRPGWHIECSVMAKELLGPTIDLHAGGVDLVFPHHENEIAQSETASGATFAHHWAHAEHLLVDHKKMSKSLGNFYTLRDLLAKDFLPTAIRYFLLSTHYRTQLNFSFQGIEAALTSIKRIRDFSDRLKSIAKKGTCSKEFQETISSFDEIFCKALLSDLNTNEALAAVFDFVRQGNSMLDAKEMSPEDAHASLLFLQRVDSIFNVIEPDEKALPQEIEALVHERCIARKNKDWTKSDAIRASIEQRGYLVEDTSSGQKITRKGLCQKE